MFYFTALPLILIIVYYVLFTKLDLTYISEDIEHNIKINGLFWCFRNWYLRRGDFEDYEHEDIPKIKFYNHTKTNLPI